MSVCVGVVGCPWCGASSEERCIDQETQEYTDLLHPERLKRASVMAEPQRS